MQTNSGYTQLIDGKEMLQMEVFVWVRAGWCYIVYRGRQDPDHTPPEGSPPSVWNAGSVGMSGWCLMTAPIEIPLFTPPRVLLSAGRDGGSHPAHPYQKLGGDYLLCPALLPPKLDMY